MTPQEIEAEIEAEFALWRRKWGALNQTVMDDLEASLRPAIAQAVHRVVERERFSPLGDNHHNAALCPYCGDPVRALRAEVTRLRGVLEKVHRDMLNHGPQLAWDCYICAALQAQR